MRQELGMISWALAGCEQQEHVEILREVLVNRQGEKCYLLATNRGGWVSRFIACPEKKERYPSAHRLCSR